MAIKKLHQFRFGVRGNPLKSFFNPSKGREHRKFPKGITHKWDYVNEYFRLNPWFKESSWQ